MLLAAFNERFAELGDWAADWAAVCAGVEEC